MKTSLLAPLAFLSVAAAQTPDQIEYFEKNVRPVLVASCQPCHNAKAKASGLDVSTPAGFFAGGAGGAVIAKDIPENSRLIKVIGYEDSLKMPPMGKLKPEQIEALTQWAKMGAPWPGAAHAAAVLPPAPKKEFTEAQKSFWAFQPIADPAPPKVKDVRWAKTPIDRFILAKLEERGIRPAPAADKSTLIRRVTFDLTGLPPTESEIRAFLADQSPKAFEAVVDRLLASPRYGERWGRHWLDVARYADSTGNDEDHRYPYAWRYRDYVIKAFNDDMPYDRFVREQVAGDLMPPAAGEKFNSRGVVATGFLALGAKAIAQVDKKKMLYDVWDEQVDVTSKAFLGLTMACARCHDHKFDPILTKDYYSMVGMFASTRSFEKVNQGVASLLYSPLVPESEYHQYRHVQSQIALQKLMQDELTDTAALKAGRASAAQVAEYMLAARRVSMDKLIASEVAEKAGLDVKVLEKWVKVLAADGGAKTKPFLDSWQTAHPAQVTRVAQAYQARYQNVFEEWNRAIEKNRVEARKKLEGDDPAINRMRYDGKDKFFAAIYLFGGPFALTDKDREKLLSAEALQQVATYKAKAEELKKVLPPEPEMADAVTEDKPILQKVALRGDFNNLGEDAPLDVPAILRKAEPGPANFTGSGRLEMAGWLTKRENPLVARVMVNRMWGWHFGEGIVNTPDNFGKMGGRPSHPELLDYLASRFVENGWSIKKMQRMMVLSSAYQMSTDTDAENQKKDPEGTLLSRFQRQRLSVEEIRDGMLAIDGTLDLTMGGTLQSGTGTDGENSSGRLSLNPETLKRRTVYLPLRRANLPTLLNLFDFGDATTVNGRRSLTNVSPQALFMMNSEFVSDRAKNVAKAILDQPGGDNRQRMNQMFLKTLDRDATAAELDAAFTYMDRFKQKFGRTELEAWQSFCHVLLTSNEFIYLE